MSNTLANRSRTMRIATVCGNRQNMIYNQSTTVAGNCWLGRGWRWGWPRSCVACWCWCWCWCKCWCWGQAESVGVGNGNRHLSRAPEELSLGWSHPLIPPGWGCRWGWGRGAWYWYGWWDCRWRCSFGCRCAIAGVPVCRKPEARDSPPH